jgi:hypothetical protein
MPPVRARSRLSIKEQLASGPRSGPVRLGQPGWAGPGPGPPASRSDKSCQWLTWHYMIALRQPPRAPRPSGLRSELPSESGVAREPERPVGRSAGLASLPVSAVIRLERLRLVPQVSRPGPGRDSVFQEAGLSCRLVLCRDSESLLHYSPCTFRYTRFYTLFGIYS